MRLIIVRHGETIENVNDISQGHIDGILSEIGLEQIKKLGERLKNEKIDFIYSSDLGRTKDTLKEIIKYHDGVPVIYDELLRERGKGIFENKPGSVYHEARLASGEGRFDYRPEGGENFYDVKKRVEKFIDYLLKEHAVTDSILICTHGGWKTGFMSYFFNMPLDEKIFQFKFKNTSVSIFELKEDQKHVVHVINCTKHLE